MRFIFDKDSMFKVVSIAKDIISTKNAMSILSNILLTLQGDKLEIRCTDTKVNFISYVNVFDTEEGSTTVYLDKFLSILSNLPSGEIEFIHDGNKIKIVPMTQKKVKFELKCLSEDNYPVTPSAPTQFFEMPAKQLKDMISFTIDSVSTDETRYFMSGILFEKTDGKLKLVSTDGRRLAYTETDGTNFPDIPQLIVPPKALSILLKKCPSEGNIEIAIEENTIWFKFQDILLCSVLLDGQYPNYTRVIPTEIPYSLTINRVDMLEALNRVGLLADANAKKIMLHYDSEKIELSAKGQDIGESSEEVSCEYDGKPMDMALNINYLQNALKTIDTEEVVFSLNEPLKAFKVSSTTDSNYFHVIMPMQIQ